jgi:hypothetical protein
MVIGTRWQGIANMKHADNDAGVQLHAALDMPDHPTVRDAPGSRPMTESASADEEVDVTGVRVEVITTSGCAQAVELRIQPDLIEVWCRDHCCGAFDRQKMRSWLADPGRPLTTGEVTLSQDPRSGGERIAISLDDVMAWTISPADLATVRRLV